MESENEVGCSLIQQPRLSQGLRHFIFRGLGRVLQVKAAYSHKGHPSLEALSRDKSEQRRVFRSTPTPTDDTWEGPQSTFQEQIHILEKQRLQNSCPVYLESSHTLSEISSHSFLHGQGGDTSVMVRNSPHRLECSENWCPVGGTT